MGKNNRRVQATTVAGRQRQGAAASSGAHRARAAAAPPAWCPAAGGRREDARHRGTSVSRRRHSQTSICCHPTHQVPQQSACPTGSPCPLHSTAVTHPPAHLCHVAVVAQRLCDGVRGVGVEAGGHLVGIQRTRSTHQRLACSAQARQAGRAMQVGGCMVGRLVCAAGSPRWRRPQRWSPQAAHPCRLPAAGKHLPPGQQ